MIQLGACRDANDILAAVGATLQLGLGSDPLPRIRRALSHTPGTLLIFDEVEHVVGHVSEVLRDLRDGQVILCTSRRTLGAPGEQVVRLEGMEPGAARELFIQRAEAVRGRSLSELELAHVDPLVERLDHIPLAIELAAARATVLSPGAMVRRLDDHGDLLRDREGRLRRAIDLSLDLISPRYQELLRGAALFRESFDLESAEAVLADDEVLDALSEFVDLSLVRSDPATSRFQLYAAVREAMVAKAATRGAVERYRAHVAARALRLADEIYGPEPGRVLSMLEADRSDLVAVANHGSLEQVAAVCIGLATLHGHRGPSRVLKQWIDNGLSASKQDHPCLHATLLEHLCQYEWSCGDGAEAGVRALRTALQLLQGADELDIARVEAKIADLEGPMRGPAAADDDAGFRRALARLEELRDHRTAGYLRGGRGLWLYNIGRHRDAEALLVRAVEDNERSDSVMMLGHSLRYLAVARYALGHRDEAVELVERAVASHRRAADREGELHALCVLGALALGTGELDLCREATRAAAELDQGLGLFGLEAERELVLGVADLEEGALEGAERHLERARRLAVSRSRRRGHFVAVILGFVAATHAVAGRLQQARTTLLDLPEDRHPVLGEALSLLVSALIDVIEAETTGELRLRSAAAQALATARRPRPDCGVSGVDWKPELTCLARIVERRLLAETS